MSDGKPRSEKFERGLKTRRAVLGEDYVQRSLDQADDFNWAMQQLTTEWCWDEIWNRPGLDRRSRSVLNLGMIAVKWTQTLNVDMWNYWHFIFSAAFVYATTGNFFLGIAVGVLTSIIILKLADFVAPVIQDTYGMPNITTPHTETVNWAPVSWTINKMIDRVPGLGPRAGHVRQLMVDKRIEARAYTRLEGEDAPEIAGWVWPYGAE